jgi:hypothetical protein
MDDEAELREEIVRLEAEIERLAQTMESCRKLILASKLAAAVAGVLIVVTLVGVISLDPARTPARSIRRPPPARLQSSAARS